MLQRDPCVAASNGLSDTDFPGTVLMRVALAPAEEAERHPWDNAQTIAELEKRNPCQVRVNVYSARGLPAADATGSADPYARIFFYGREVRTRVQRQTRDPSW